MLCHPKPILFSRFLSAILRCLAVALCVAIVPMHAALDAPVSPNALPAVTTLMNALAAAQGNYIFSGQQERSWDPNGLDFDVNYIIANTGKTPAVRGFDFLEYVYSPSQRAGETATERAIAWSRNGGIVTFCCHMFMNIGSTNGQPQFYVPSANGGVGTNFDIRQAVISGTPENTEFLAKLDIIAGELTKLRDAGVPVIWRPFHECSGGWFWWGRYGAEPFKQAWTIMFNRFTQQYGLNNLIWCYNPTDTIATNMPAWYPGDNMVDMISNDVYPTAGTHPSFAAAYQQMRDFKAGRKIVAMSENGSIPDPDTLFAEGAGWSYFCTWNGFENDLSRNTVAFLQKVYAHAKVITLDELPAYYTLVPTTAAPVITYQPASRTVNQGISTTFAADASGTPTPTFQWKKDGVAISGATSNTYTIASVNVSDAGDYTVVATNSVGSATSNLATLTVNAAPVITTQPQDRTTILGGAATFTATASGTPVPAFQWRKDGVDISGATNASYTLASVSAGDVGLYSLVATNSIGSAASVGARLQLDTIPAGFDVNGYLVRYPAIAAVYGTDHYSAWLYYRDHGIYNGEVFDDLFRVEEYLTLYPELFAVFGSDLSGALMHWLTQGSIEGRLGRIPLVFSAQGYFTRNPDVATAVGNNALLAWGHFWLYGIYEGRAYDDELNVFEYLAINADLTAAFVNDWRQAALHWMRYGRTEGRLGRIPLIFNVTEYLNRNPDVAATWGTFPTTVFLHYWSYGITEGRTFDDEFRPTEYLALNPDLAAVFGSDLRGGFKHWVRYGKTEGRPGKNP